MNTIIYLYNGQVQIVTGNAGSKPSLKGYFMVDAPEGSIINGIVMDVESFTAFLKQTWAERHLSNKDVILVLNSSKFVGRNIELPKMNDKKSIQYIAREYSDLGRDNKSIFGYVDIKNEKKTKKVYAETVDPEFIKDYVSIFSAAGIKLKAIYSSESSLIGFTKRTTALNHKNFDLIIAEENTLTTILFIDGLFSYYNTIRCFHDMGTIEYAEDIARSVSQMNQFLRANQSESNLDNVIIAGIDSNDINMYRGAIEAAGYQTPVQAFTFPNGLWREASVQKYIHSVCGLFPHDKSQNFLLQLDNKATSGEKKNKGLMKTLIIIGAIFVLMVVATVVSVFVKNGKQKELDDILEINESPSRMLDLALYDEYMIRNTYLREQHRATLDVEENIQTYPVGNQKVLNKFNDCARGYAEIEYNSFDATKGEISIVAKSDEVENINKFIKNLLEDSMFTSVDYTGYHYSDSNDLWDIEVTCVLAEKAGRDIKERVRD